MSRYTAISTDIWNDREFRKLTPTGKLLYFYILTNPSTNQAGFYRLVKDDVEYVLGKKGKAELLKGTPLYKYDEVNEVVWIPNYLKYNFAKSKQQTTGVNRAVERLPYCDLMVDFYVNFLKYSGEAAVKSASASVKEYVIKNALLQGTMEKNALAHEMAKNPSNNKQNNTEQKNTEHYTPVQYNTMGIDRV